MGCACEAVHGFDCQFPAETQFYSFDGRDWCLLHLPLKDANGNNSPKASWIRDDPDRQRFEDEVFDRLRNPIDESPHPIFNHAISDLRAVAFPPEFSFAALAGTTLDPDFSHATFGNGTSFIRATFGNQTYFTDATFGTLADFTGATFGNWTDFTGATFGDGTWFINATFGNGADFTRATFGPGANFSAGEGEARRDLFQKIGFDGAQFHGSADFNNRRFIEPASFANAVFHDIPLFHGCTFHQGMSFHQTSFRKTKGENDSETAELERAYRTLKLAMENLRARNEEADFFALEMECRRQRGDVPWFERVAAGGYKLVSDYGRSISRPVGCLAVSLVVFALVYWNTGWLTNPSLVQEPGQFLFDLAVLTLEQLVKPFSVWTRSSSSAQLPLVDSNPLLLPILASLQSLFNLSLLAIFLLALRRRFKMD